MSKSRKDAKGRVLRTGETYRECDGRYVYRYTDPLGHRRAIYAPTLLELREREKQLIRDQADGMDIYLSGSATLNYVFDRYIATKYNIKPQTKSSYVYFYDRFVRRTMGKRRIADIRYSDIKFFYCKLLSEKKLQLNTIGNIHTVLHPTFTMAVRDGIIRINPTDGVIREINQMSGKNKGVRHALTIEQQRAFLTFIKDNPMYDHWLPLFEVLFGTGMRIGEAIGLRWEDIDFEDRTISVNHAIIYRMMEAGKMEQHVSTPKTTAGIRYIPMMDRVYDAFLAEQAFQKETGLCNIDEIDGMSGFIFCNKNGLVHKASVINSAIRRIYETYNAEERVKAKRERREAVIIPHFSCHHIRHTFCTRLCENESNLKAIQDIMGHANIETTMDIYAEATAKSKKEAISELQKNMDLF